MNDWDKYAAGVIARHEARKVRRCDAAVDFIVSVLLGLAGAVLIMHWAGGWLL